MQELSFATTYLPLFTIEGTPCTNPAMVLENIEACVAVGISILKKTHDMLDELEDGKTQLKAACDTQ